MNSRQDLLVRLMDGSDVPEALVNALGRFPWDSETAVVTLDRKHAKRVLERYLAGELTADWLEAWGNAIEGREDIGFEAGHETIIAETIYQLANPLLTEAISATSIEHLMKRL